MRQPLTAKQALLYQKHLFLLALSFLTRLAPGKPASLQDMGASCIYYPVVGLLLGSILTLPFYLGAAKLFPALQAWLFLLGYTYITRALHHDGLADTCDAFGSNKTGKAFQQVLLDSRIGAFGAIGLIVFYSGHFIMIYECLQYNLYAPLLLGPAFSRSLPVFLAALTPAHPQSQLGKLVSEAPGKTAIVVACCLFFPLSLFLCGILITVCTLFAGALCLSVMKHLAHKAGGYNGDFFGALVLAGELCLPFAALLCTSTVT